MVNKISKQELAEAFCVVPVCDHSLVPLWSTIEMAISSHVCETTAGSGHHFQGVGVHLACHLQTKKLLHFSESVFKRIQRAAPDPVGGTDPHLREKLGQIILDRANRNEQLTHKNLNE